MSNTERRWAGRLMIAIGVGILLMEVGLHLYAALGGAQYELNHAVIAIGMVFGRRRTDPVGVPIGGAPVVPMAPPPVTQTAERQGAPKQGEEGNTP
jgi:hypothetical protein